MKISAADTNFSKCVREASDWTCLKCKTKYERGSQGLHNSHIFSRRHRTIRWSKLNTKALCFSCHQWFGGNPVDSGYWITELFGEGRIQLLRELRDSGIKVPKTEEKEIAKHYRLELKKILEKRAEGQTGFIDFISYQ